MNIIIKDCLGVNISIQERECPVCHFPGALAMVDDQQDSKADHPGYFVAWCPCATVFELNDDGPKVLTKREKDVPQPEWWKEKR